MTPAQREEYLIAKALALAIEVRRCLPSTPTGDTECAEMEAILALSTESEADRQRLRLGGRGDLLALLARDA